MIVTPRAAEGELKVDDVPSDSESEQSRDELPEEEEAVVSAAAVQEEHKAGGSVKQTDSALTSSSAKRPRAVVDDSHLHEDLL